MPPAALLRPNFHPVMNSELLFLAGLLIVLFSPLIGVLAGLQWNRRKCEDTTRWSRAPGLIEYSTVQVKNPGPDDHIQQYFAYVRYAYQVGGATLRNDQVWLNSLHQTKTYDQAELIAERYFTGRKVMVFFDPRHPERAVLEPGFHAGAYADAFRNAWMFAFLPALVLLMIFFCWLGQFMK
jgi:hypothetical protein